MVYVVLSYLVLLKFLSLRLAIAEPAASGGTKLVSESCPINQHAICNEHSKATKCVCGMYETSDPPPERTCSTLLNITGSDQLEAVSAKIRLSKALLARRPADAVDNFLEQNFVDALARKFQIDKRNIIILRLKCVVPSSSSQTRVEEAGTKGDDDGSSSSGDEGGAIVTSPQTLRPDHDLVIQFVILRRGRRPEMAPFRRTDLLLADTVASRIKNSRDLDNIGGFSIVNIEKVNELMPLENNLDNSLLATQAIVAALFVLSTLLCACCIWRRRRRAPEAKGYESAAEHSAAHHENNSVVA